MAQHVSGQASPRSPQPFSQAQDPAVTSGLFWARLLTYRPLFLLGGLWLTLVCVSAIAYHGLMFNEPVEEAATAPLSVMAAPTGDGAAAPEAASSEEPAARSGVALWGLVSLVGLCAFGSFVLTQQIKASARPPKRKKARPHPVVKASAPVRPLHPKRLAPYSPQRDGVIAPGARIVEAPPREPSPEPPAGPGSPTPLETPAVAKFRVVSKSPPPGRRSLPDGKPPQPAVARAAPVPAATSAVVPPEADLPLDWAEGSVAHALDMRQRRSLSSLM